MMSSIVTMPSVPPYSSTTTARWVRLARISASAASTGLLPGSSGAGRAMSPTVRTSGSPAPAATVVSRSVSRSRTCTTPTTSSTVSPMTG